MALQGLWRQEASCDFIALEVGGYLLVMEVSLPIFIGNAPIMRKTQVFRPRPD